MEKPKVRVKKHVAIVLSLVLGLSITLFVTMLLFNVTDYGITIASFGATIFMILSKSNVRKKVVFGSYLVGGSVGFLFSRLSDMKSFNVGLAAISAVILMTILELQHAPAIGMAIAMVLNRFTFWTDIIILFCIFSILTMVMLLRYFLKDPSQAFSFLEIEEEKIKWNIRKKEVPEYLKMRMDSSD